MENTLINAICWLKPWRSTLILIVMNISFWLLIGQRPLFILSTIILINFLRDCWKRIRGVVLVDPPDNENWTSLEAYQLKFRIQEIFYQLIKQYIQLRTKSHPVFSLVSCLVFVGIGKLGTYFYLRTILFIIGNGAFLIVPIYKILPYSKKNYDHLEGFPDSTKILKEAEDLILPQPELGTSSLVDFISSAGSIVNSEALISGLLLSKVPGHDEDSEEEFQFDAKHFDSSSSSTSNSFELLSL